MTKIVLSAPGYQPFTIGGPGNRFELIHHDLGYAEPREVSQDATDADGKIDTTRYIADRVVTLRMLLDRVSWLEEQQLRAFMLPRLRPTMTIINDGIPDRQLTVRGGPYIAPGSAEDFHARQRQVIAQWVAPAGIIESVEVVPTIIYPAAPPPDEGVEFPVELPVEFQGGGAPGAGLVTNLGSADVYPILRIFGPCGGDQPIVAENRTVGRSLVLDDLTINAGDYVEIDLRYKTVRLNGVPGAASSLRDKVVFPDTRWWWLPPGVSDIRFLPEVSAAPAQLHVRHRHGWQ